MSSEYVPALFTGLVDDAGLFPPEELPMADALARHQHDQADSSAVLTGRFLCPAARLPELLDHLASIEHLELGLISPLEAAPLQTALDSIATDSRVELVGVEGTLGEVAALATVPDGVPCFVETPRGDLEAIAAASAAGYGVKVRCGGLRPELFPSADELAAFISACARHLVPFKATAGLHHALPYRDSRTGFNHHGFVNLVLAACRAAKGAPLASLVDVLSSTHLSALVAEARDVDAELARAARRVLVSFGSCSTLEPVRDLHMLGLLKTVVVSA